MLQANKLQIRAIALVVSATFALATCVAAAGSDQSPTASPATDATKSSPAQMAALGKPLFLRNCSPCHGANGQGDDGPSLHGLGIPESAIESIVGAGFKNEMPSFTGKLKPTEITKVATYVAAFK